MERPLPPIEANLFPSGSMELCLADIRHRKCGVLLGKLISSEQLSASLPLAVSYGRMATLF
jgi:hypothetical protein